MGLTVVRGFPDNVRLAVAWRSAGLLVLRLTLEERGPVLGPAAVTVLDHDDLRIAVARPHTRHQASALLSLGAADPFEAASGMLMKDSEHDFGVQSTLGRPRIARNQDGPYHLPTVADARGQVP